MKQEIFITKRGLSFAVILHLILLSGCKNKKGIIIPIPATMEITAISPDSGKFGTEVTISGSNFGMSPQENTVTFNGMSAAVISADETELVAKVPRGAGSGPVSVTVNGQMTAGPGFNYQLTTVVSTVAGNGTAGYRDGQGDQAQFNNPIGVTVLGDGQVVVADYYTNTVRMISSAGAVETIVPTAGVLVENKFSDIIFTSDKTKYVITGYDDHIIYFGSLPEGVSFQLGDYGEPGYKDGPLPDPGNEIRFNRPRSINRSMDGRRIYIVDQGNHCIRMIDYDRHGVVTFAGTNAAGFKDGKGPDARFNTPAGMDIESAGTLYVADRDNNSIRKISPEGEVTTVAGTGIAAHRDGPAYQALFNEPRGVAIDGKGIIYVADYGNNSIRKITPDGEVSTIIMGLSQEGFRDGVAQADHPSGIPLARINGPNDLDVDEDGTIFFTEANNHAVRRITLE